MTSTSAKQEILDRIRASLAITQKEPAPLPPRTYRQDGEQGPAVVDEMQEKLEDYNARVFRCDEAGVPDAINQALEGCSSVVIPVGLPRTWRKAAEKGRTLHVDGQPPISHAELNEIDAVVTGSRCAVALSGTIMLDGEPDQGRRAITLIPDTHVVVLYEKDIYPVVPQAVEVLMKNPTRPTTWIAGPSATSDIELIRVDGVHGPRNLAVIIVK